MALQSLGRSLMLGLPSRCLQAAKRASEAWGAAVPEAVAGQCRCMSYASPRPTGASSGPRRVAAAGGSSGAAAAEAGPGSTAASTSGGGLLEMDKEVPGGRKPMATWEKWYWGVGVLAVSVMLFKYLSYKPPKTPEQLEAERQAAAALEVQRKEAARAALMTNNFIKGDKDPLDGLSPAGIERFLELAKIDPLDPLEGLTPEEIDAYMKQHTEEEELEGAGQ